MGYALIAPVADDVSISVERLYEALTVRFSDEPSTSVALNRSRGNGKAHVELLLANWSLRVHLEDGPHVIEESKELAAFYALGRPDADAIARCRRRITVDSDDDEGMAYFNCYVFVCETIESCGCVALFDPKLERFLD